MNTSESKTLRQTSAIINQPASTENLFRQIYDIQLEKHIRGK